VLHTLEWGSVVLPLQADGDPSPAPLGHTVRAQKLALLHPFGDAEFYRHGWNSWSPTAWTRLSGETVGIKDNPERLLTADDAAHETPLAHSGSAVGALATEDGMALLVGALGLGSPRVGADIRTLWASSDDPDAEWYIGFGPEREVFAAYAALVGDRLGRRSGRAGRVWCSWYSYFEGIDEDLVARTVDDTRGYDFDVFQLDDGWEPKVGDWVAGPSFPSGMAATASRISAAGFRPGLWLAPLIALPESEIARTRPDLMVQDETGRPLVAGHNWGSHYYALDTTLPEVRDHLRDVFERVVGWGFTYLKLDFMYAGAIPGVRSTGVPREQAYREGVQHIRQVVGDDVYLLGCGVPMLPSVGVFDGARVGPDVAAYWANAERPGDPTGVGAHNSLVTSLSRAWMRPLYEVDPDVVYLRSARNLLGPVERQVLRDASVAVGFRSTSDPVSWLRPEERDELRAYLAADPAVEQVGRYAFRLDDRLVDLTPYIDGSAHIDDVSWAG
jgi:alpha-galactosidase